MRHSQQATTTLLQFPGNMAQAAGVQADPVDGSSLSPLGIWQLNPLGEDEAVSYFLSEYSVAPLPGIYSGHLDFLRELLIPSSSTSPLRPATHASGYLALSRHYKSPGLYDMARKHYGVALRSVNANLSQPAETWQDDIIGAIMLLHQFEVFHHFLPSRPYDRLELTIRGYGW